MQALDKRSLSRQPAGAVVSGLSVFFLFLSLKLSNNARNSHSAWRTPSSPIYPTFWTILLHFQFHRSNFNHVLFIYAYWLLHVHKAIHRFEANGSTPSSNWQVSRINRPAISVKLSHEMAYVYVMLTDLSTPFNFILRNVIAIFGASRTSQNSNLVQHSEKLNCDRSRRTISRPFWIVHPRPSTLKTFKNGNVECWILFVNLTATMLTSIACRKF
jgi:hypothetical protein